MLSDTHLCTPSQANQPCRHASQPASNLCPGPGAGPAHPIRALPALPTRPPVIQAPLPVCFGTTQPMPRMPRCSRRARGAARFSLPTPPAQSVRLKHGRSQSCLVPTGNRHVQVGQAGSGSSHLPLCVRKSSAHFCSLPCMSRLPMIVGSTLTTSVTPGTPGARPAQASGWVGVCEVGWADSRTRVTRRH